MRLRVLMYHSISADGSKSDLTVSREQLEEQFQYIRDKGYTSIGFSELLAFHQEAIPLPSKPVLITFDDGFADNYEIAYPLARKYGMKMNIFLVPHFIRARGYRSLECMGPEMIRKMDPALVQFGLHSFGHQSYASLSPEEAGEDIRQCKQYFAEEGIVFQPCLAYPYGDYPKRNKIRQRELFEQMDGQSIKMAFRIGNRLNRIPLRQPFLIQRIDVRGDESVRVFRRALRFGKKWI